MKIRCCEKSKLSHLVLEMLAFCLMCSAQTVRIVWQYDTSVIFPKKKEKKFAFTFTEAVAFGALFGGLIIISVEHSPM